MVDREMCTQKASMYDRRFNVDRGFFYFPNGKSR